jgi:electron transfer flavoprotein beta subunit
MSADHTLTIVVAVGLSSDLPNSDDSGAAAVIAALGLHENGNTPEIVAVSVGRACAEEALLAALARGAKRAVLVETETDNPRATSLLISGLVRREKPDLVVFGDRSLDDPACQIGPRMSAIIGWPHASGVREIVIRQDRKSCQVVREIDGIGERLQMAMPAVLSVNTGDVDVPLLSLYDIVAARSKPIKRVKGASLASPPQAGFTVLKSEPATIQRKCRIVGTVDELIAALREEAHVI